MSLSYDLITFIHNFRRYIHKALPITITMKLYSSIMCKYSYIKQILRFLNKSISFCIFHLRTSILQSGPKRPPTFNLGLSSHNRLYIQLATQMYVRFCFVGHTEANMHHSTVMTNTSCNLTLGTHNMCCSNYKVYEHFFIRI